MSAKYNETKNLLENKHGKLPIEFVNTEAYSLMNMGETPVEVVCMYNALHNEIIARHTDMFGKRTRSIAARDEALEYISDVINDFSSLLETVLGVADKFENWKG